MFFVYFDDSGTHLESDVAVAACYIIEREQLVRLESDWERAKQDEGFAVFGMSDALNGTKEYRQWPKEKRELLVHRLITLIRVRTRIGIAVSVIKRDYDRIITHDELRGRMGKFHYTFAVRSCLALLKDWRHQFGGMRPMKFVFDQMSQGKGEVEGLLKDIMSRGYAEYFGVTVSNYSFESKTNLPGLQAADILAHEAYRTTLNEIIAPGSKPRHYMEQLAKTPMMLKYWTTEMLEYIRDTNIEHFEKTGWFPPLTNAKGPVLKS